MRCFLSLHRRGLIEKLVIIACMVAFSGHVGHQFEDVHQKFFVSKYVQCTKFKHNVKHSIAPNIHYKNT